MKLFLLASVSAFAMASASANALETFSYGGHLVDWTAQSSNTYRIDVYGAQGGEGTGPGGFGVGLGGDFYLTAGETLQIAVGGQGNGFSTGAGGGGSFVATSGGAPLIVAGGGGGSGFNPISPSPGGDATIATGNGQGGSGGGGGGGGGFYSAGGAGGAYSLEYGWPVITSEGGGDFPDLAGGTGIYGSGGFGGGGGSGYNGGGGGGGFGGGYSGGGGSSFNSGTNPSDLGYHGGDGLVTIALPEPSSWTLMLTGLGFLGYVLRRRVSRRA